MTDSKDAGSTSPGKMAWRQILHHPPSCTSLFVFLLILIICWVLPPLWPHSSSNTNLSLGASPPLANIWQLIPEDTGWESRRITEPRGRQLRRNAVHALGEETASDQPLQVGDTIQWIELPLVLTNESGDPLLPTWLYRSELPDYSQYLKNQLGLDKEEVQELLDQYQQVFVIEDSPVWFLAGTDELGRDLWVRILEGGRISIAVGFAATLVSITIGILYGGISGYLGGRVDTVLMRIVDVLYALPFLIFVILLMALFPRSLLLLFLAIGAVEWLTTARIVRGEVLSLRKLPFVDAARCLGLSHWKILRRHLLPNTIPPVIVYATLTIPTVILLESVLSFLGLGVQPPASSWGILISEGADRMETYPWMLLYPSLFFAATLLSLNFLGDGLRDILDPKTRK